MRKANKLIIFVTALAIVIAVGMYLNRRHSPPSEPSPPPGNAAEQTTRRPPIHVERAPAPVDAPERPGQVLVQIPTEMVDEYVRQHNRNAASLITAFHALQNTNYLLEAATNFPNDPRVQWTVLARNVFPEDRRKWLDAFKNSSNSNSLANYLSAQEYFKNHESDAAIKELTEASRKSQFTDYTMETILDSEDFGRFNGSSQLDTFTGAMSAMASDDLPQLAGLKAVAVGIRDLQQQYVASGDSASAETLAQSGMTLANHLMSGDSGKIIINQLVGMSSAAIVLDSLDKNTSYDFLGGKTPTQLLAEFKQTRITIRDINQSVTPVIPTLTEAQLAGFWERLKIFGELNAAQWLQQQTATTPNSGN